MKAGTTESLQYLISYLLMVVSVFDDALIAVSFQEHVHWRLKTESRFICTLSSFGLHFTHSPTCSGYIQKNGSFTEGSSVWVWFHFSNSWYPHLAKAFSENSNGARGTLLSKLPPQRYLFIYLPLRAFELLGWQAGLWCTLPICTVYPDWAHRFQSNE